MKTDFKKKTKTTGDTVNIPQQKKSGAAAQKQVQDRPANYRFRRLTVITILWNRRTLQVTKTSVTAGIPRPYWKARFYLSGKSSEWEGEGTHCNKGGAEGSVRGVGNQTKSKQSLKSWIPAANRGNIQKMHAHVVQPTTCQRTTRGRWLPKGTGTDSVSMKDASALIYTELFFTGWNEGFLLLHRKHSLGQTN